MSLIRINTLDKYNSLKGCVLEVDLEYPKDLRELHNYYLLAPGKIEIKQKCSLTIN